MSKRAPLVVAMTGAACLVVAAWMSYGVVAGLVVAGITLLLVAPLLAIAAD